MTDGEGWLLQVLARLVCLSFYKTYMKIQHNRPWPTMQNKAHAPARLSIGGTGSGRSHKTVDVAHAPARLSIGGTGSRRSRKTVDVAHAPARLPMGGTGSRRSLKIARGRRPLAAATARCMQVPIGCKHHSVYHATPLIARHIIWRVLGPRGQAMPASGLRVHIH